MMFVFTLGVSIYSNNQYCILVNMILKYIKFKDQNGTIQYLTIKRISNIWKKEDYIRKEEVPTINCCKFCVILLFIYICWLKGGNVGRMPRNKITHFYQFLGRISQKVALNFLKFCVNKNYFMFCY